MSDFTSEEIDKEFALAYEAYRDYFSTLDAHGIASFMMGSDHLLGGFYTSGGADLELDKLLYQTRLRGITRALLEHPTAPLFTEDFKALANLAGIDEITPKAH